MQECVVTPADPNDIGFQNFVACRGYRRQSVMAACEAGGLDAACATIVSHMENPGTCTFGNCGEAALVFAARARSIGIPEDEIHILHTPNDHIFVTIPNPDRPGDRMILDRWTITDTGQVGRGNVITGVTLVGGTIHINGVPSRNTWYQGLTEQTMREHMAQESRGALPPDPLKDTWELVDRCVPGATYQASGLTCTLASCTPVTFPRGGTPAGLQPGRTYYRWTSNCRPNDPAPVIAPARRIAPPPVIRR